MEHSWSLELTQISLLLAQLTTQLTVTVAQLLFDFAVSYCAYNFLNSISHSTTGDTECQDGVTNNCSHTCTRNHRTYECGCHNGFSLNDTSPGICDGDTQSLHAVMFCLLPCFYPDVDECLTGTHNCSAQNNEICVDIEGSFDCICAEGFSRETNESTICQGMYKLDNNSVC